MRKISLKIIIDLLVVSTLSAVNANAVEFDMRPGLWQITTTSDLLLLAPHIPPDQMQSLKDLATVYGVDMPQIENGAAISETCISQEIAAQKTLPNFYQSQLGCTSKNAIRTGNNYKVTIVCESAEFKGSGTTTGTLIKPQAFTGKTQFMGEAQGNPVDEKANISGKWISENCGKQH